MYKYSPEEVSILQKYVTDINGNVYCITNLPEEVVAVIFAYVSRSPLSFRENLLKLVKGDMEQSLYVGEIDHNHFEIAKNKAIDFHRRITLGYGHSSVSELSTARVGIEKISRLASAELELANPFISFIEYSQRYQKPTKGAVYIPHEIQEDPSLQTLFIDTCNQLYDYYEEVFHIIHEYHLKNTPTLPDESEAMFYSRTEKLAFEDARYLLPLATYTNLGMVGNARAIRDCLVHLFSSEYTECQKLAKAIKNQVTLVLPTLLRHAEYSPYLVNAHKKLSAYVNSKPSFTTTNNLPGVELIDYTGKDFTDPELIAVQKLLSSAINSSAGMGVFPEAWQNNTSKEDLITLFQEITNTLGTFDNPLGAFTSVKYRFRFHISEANWHQFLRHTRKIHFSWSPPRIDLGITIPSNIQKAGAEDVFMKGIALSESVFKKIYELSPQAACYLVTNAHHRRIISEFDLWELYHLINLRTTPEAQWDIRQTIEEVERKVQKVHPVLLQYARRRTKVL